MTGDHTKNLQNFYDEEYVDNFEKFQSPSRLGRLMKYISVTKDSDVADFGCGNGLLLGCLKDKVGTYSGIDFSDFFITAARKRQKRYGISNAEFFCESIESFCFRYHEKFDAGFVMDLAEHVYDQEWTIILASIRSSLKPGSKLYLHTPNAEFFLEILKKKNVIFHQFKEHVAVRDISQNIRLLEVAGFFNFEVKLLPHYNILRYVHVLSFFPLIGKYFKARIFIIAERKE